MNIVSYKWILACIEKGFLVDLEPQYMVHSNEVLQEYFSQNLDPYSDHYTQPCDPKRLREIIEAISNDSVEFQVIDLDQQVEEVINEGKKWLGKKFYFANDAFGDMSEFILK